MLEASLKKAAPLTYPRNFWTHQMVFSRWARAKHTLQKAAVLGPESGNEARRATICAEEPHIGAREG